MRKAIIFLFALAVAIVTAAVHIPVTMMEEPAVSALPDSSPVSVTPAAPTPPPETLPDGQPPLAPPEQAAPLTLTFGGDVLLDRGVAGLIGPWGDYGQVVAPELTALFSESALAFVNLELPFSTRGQPLPDKTYTFRGNPAHLGFLPFMGIDAVTLANNHMLDYGTDAMMDTVALLDALGIGHTGAGDSRASAAAPSLLTAQGQRIAFLGASRVVPSTDWHAGKNKPGLFTTYDPAALNAAIAEARDIADLVVVYVHWGEEMNDQAQPYQIELAHGYIDAGADLVIGSHPHVVQGLEFYQGKLIAYSLGNFVFTDADRDTMALQVSYEGADMTGAQVFFAHIHNLKTALVTEPAAKADMRAHLQALSPGVVIDEAGWVLPG
ncbi:MAG: CapA family protein [Oscillospiraceae bacterium]|jgi:poly-gamma-glutamate synthesis protein (capsule biosynthesis protein)|nr:CapA family protein [Oscillospiraceae bacterium]